MTVLSLTDFIEQVSFQTSKTGSLDLNSLSILADQVSANVHLSVMRSPYLDYVIAGRKTAESRITKNRIVPYGVVESGDFILFKQSSGPIRAVGKVRRSVSMEVRDLDHLRTMTGPFSKELAYDVGYLEQKHDARYCTLIFMFKTQSVADIDFRKRGRQTWVIARPNLD